MDPSMVLGIIQAGEGLSPAFNMFRGMKKDATSHRGAEAAYIAFQSAATESLAHISYIVSIGVPSCRYRRIVDLAAGV